MSVAVGTFAVSSTAADVATFRRAARLEETGETLPFTWPIRWMAGPEIRTALKALVPEADLVPFHESQAFDYAAPLRANTPYTLAVIARRETTPERRLVVEGRITADGVSMATIETVLRLFPTQAAQHG